MSTKKSLLTSLILFLLACAMSPISSYAQSPQSADSLARTLEALYKAAGGGKNKGNRIGSKEETTGGDLNRLTLPGQIIIPKLDEGEFLGPMGTQVFSGGGGVSYGIKRKGDLVWCKHRGYENGDSSWANGGDEIIIGTGWQYFMSRLVN